MEETRFKTDHSQHVNDKKPTRRLRPYATKINFICRDLQKKEKKKYQLKLVFQSDKVSAV